MVVSGFTPTPSGFTVNFSKAFDPSKLTMYGPPGTVQDVTLVGAKNGAISGTLAFPASMLDPVDQSITFSATSASLLQFFNSPVLPDDTYTVTLRSGSAGNGFFDMLGAALDGTDSGGHADYVATFTTNYQAAKTPVLKLPDFARGPDGASTIKVPNDSSHGIPVTLYNAVSVTDVAFTLIQTGSVPNLLTLQAVGGAGSDATDPNSSLTMLLTPLVYYETMFVFHDKTPQTGTVVLGDILASVPDSAAAAYKAKELLSFSDITINTSAAGAVGTTSVHVNAYFGDVTGNGAIDALDVATANNVAQGLSTGFGAYTLLDPAIIGDVAGDISVDAGDVSTLAAYVSKLPTPVIPAIPAGLTITPVGPDPTLNLGGGQVINGVVNVPVLLDHPHPAGSTGIMEAVLALTYDPSVLGVSASDITLGTIPSAGWQLSAVVDAEKGQIGIEVFSTQAITATQAGSLVSIAFHVQPGATEPATAVQLANRTLIGGQQFTTQVDDALGQYVLSPGMDRLTVQTGVSQGTVSSLVESMHVAAAARSGSHGQVTTRFGYLPWKRRWRR
jgi:hypothetical protein